MPAYGDYFNQKKKKRSKEQLTRAATKKGSFASFTFTPPVVSLETKTREAVVVFLPAELLVTAAHGYGNLPLGSVYFVGELDSRGEAVLSDTISDLVGLPVNAVWSPKEGFLDQQSLGRLSFINQEIFQKSSTHKLDWLLLALNWLLVRSDKITVLDPKASGLIESIVLADGSQSLYLDPNRLDKLTSGLFYSQKIRSEVLRVGVLNSTQVDGLGNRVARLLSNFGASVVAVQTTTPQITSCLVTFRDPNIEKSQTVDFIESHLHCQKKLEPELDNRYDLTIILGT